MKAYRIFSGRNADALERIERDTREPAAREVRVRVHAVSLNYRDLMIARGNYPVSHENPPIAVADGAGEAVAVLRAAKRLVGIAVGSRAMFEYFNRFVAQARIRPAIDRVFGSIKRVRTTPISNWDGT